MRKLDSGSKTIKLNMSFPVSLRRRATARARSLGTTLSAYVRKLIEDDLANPARRLPPGPPQPGYEARMVLEDDDGFVVVVLNADGSFRAQDSEAQEGGADVPLPGWDEPDDEYRERLLEYITSVPQDDSTGKWARHPAGDAAAYFAGRDVIVTAVMPTREELKRRLEEFANGGSGS